MHMYVSIIWKAIHWNITFDYLSMPKPHLVFVRKRDSMCLEAERNPQLNKEFFPADLPQPRGIYDTRHMPTDRKWNIP